jgi:histidinol phosphatase-like PHP family hydrolase
MRNKLLQAVKSHAQGHIDKHIANVEVYLNQSVGIGEHSNIIEAIEMELEEISKYQDQIDILEKYFPLQKELQNDSGLIGGKGYTTTSTLG